MKTIYLVVLSLVIFSCQNQAKIDLEKEKQAAIDSVKVEMEKQRLIDSMRVEMAQKEKQKEVVIVNQNTTTKRKGWSNTAKGAVIGAGVGAATGAIISDKKGEGAIIGGLAGAGVGAGTGAIIDENKKE